jgi:hypothetical protein
MEVSSKHGFELCCFISLQCMHDNDCGGYVWIPLPVHPFIYVFSL